MAGFLPSIISSATQAVRNRMPVPDGTAEKAAPLEAHKGKKPKGSAKTAVKPHDVVHLAAGAKKTPAQMAQPRPDLVSGVLAQQGGRGAPPGEQPIAPAGLMAPQAAGPIQGGVPPVNTPDDSAQNENTYDGQGQYIGAATPPDPRQKILDDLNTKLANPPKIENPGMDPGAAQHLAASQAHFKAAADLLDQRMQNTPPNPQNMKAGWGIFLGSIAAALADARNGGQAGLNMYQGAKGAMDTRAKDIYAGKMGQYQHLQASLGEQAAGEQAAGKNELSSGTVAQNQANSWHKLQIDALQKAHTDMTKISADITKEIDAGRKDTLNGQKTRLAATTKAISDAATLDNSPGGRMQAAKMIADAVQAQMANGDPFIPVPGVHNVMDVLAASTMLANAQYKPQLNELTARSREQATINSKQLWTIRGEHEKEWNALSDDRKEAAHQRALHLINQTGMDAAKATHLALQNEFLSQTMESRVNQTKQNLLNGMQRYQEGTQNMDLKGRAAGIKDIDDAYRMAHEDAGRIYQHEIAPRQKERDKIVNDATNLGITRNMLMKGLPPGENDSQKKYLYQRFAEVDGLLETSKAGYTKASEAALEAQKRRAAVTPPNPVAPISPMPGTLPPNQQPATPAAR